jgi:hypothetical protein
VCVYVCFVCVTINNYNNTGRRRALRVWGGWGFSHTARGAGAARGRGGGGAAQLAACARALGGGGRGSWEARESGV